MWARLARRTVGREAGEFRGLGPEGPEGAQERGDDTGAEDRAPVPPSEAPKGRPRPAKLAIGERAPSHAVSTVLVAMPPKSPARWGLANLAPSSLDMLLARDRAIGAARASTADTLPQVAAHVPERMRPEAEGERLAAPTPRSQPRSPARWGLGRAAGGASTADVLPQVAPEQPYGEQAEGPEGERLAPPSPAQADGAHRARLAPPPPKAKSQPRSPARRNLTPSTIDAFTETGRVVGGTKASTADVLPQLSPEQLHGEARMSPMVSLPINLGAERRSLLGLKSRSRPPTLDDLQRLTDDALLHPYC